MSEHDHLIAMLNRLKLTVLRDQLDNLIAWRQGVNSGCRWTSSQSGVAHHRRQDSPNTVYVSASYSRLPPFFARLTRAMNTIEKVGGPGVSLLDLAKRPHGRDVTIDDASGRGRRIVTPHSNQPLAAKKLQRLDRERYAFLAPLSDGSTKPPEKSRSRSRF